MIIASKDRQQFADPFPFNVPAVAPFRIIRAAAPYMRIKDADKRENRSIIFVSSTTGTHGNTGQLNYAAAKAGKYKSYQGWIYMVFAKPFSFCFLLTFSQPFWV